MCTLSPKQSRRTKFTNIVWIIQSFIYQSEHNLRSSNFLYVTDYARTECLSRGILWSALWYSVLDLFGDTVKPIIFQIMERFLTVQSIMRCSIKRTGLCLWLRLQESGRIYRVKHDSGKIIRESLEQGLHCILSLKCRRASCGRSSLISRKESSGFLLPEMCSHAMLWIGTGHYLKLWYIPTMKNVPIQFPECACFKCHPH